ncbi:phospholipase [Alicyclobacillus tolerans]|uniref:alkaline phosphatase family protein n=1 Tax=Alicyclobacillus tolerans TaxID=90970 RepID=UPI001F438962|nr:alkaline phosphatase family protein [Alicyclobacillus tolerans]MCF8566178.1 phospholipase [Alicyclobacillus tolerans]
MKRSFRSLKLSAAAMVAITLGTSTIAMANGKPAVEIPHGVASAAVMPQTATPIKHVVVIFQENVSFDHYFGTYPKAANLPGEPAFYPTPGTPTVNGLNSTLLTHNPNLANPQRLDRNQSITDDMDHGYTAEQKAYNGGLVNQFVQDVAGTSWPFKNGNPNEVMDYYDGNTVTALWNYAQHFSLNDNSFGTNFGPSTPGALNLVAGTTHGAVGYSAPQKEGGTQLQPNPTTGVIIPGTLDKNNTLFNDIDPYYDSASNSKKPTVAMTGQNVGNLLNAKGITWGWFEGGFSDPTRTNQAVGNGTETPAPATADYIPHHDPFQYYQSTANPNHLPPMSTAMIGHQGDQANHNYGMSDFWKAVDAGNMPAVSFLKAPAYQDGHAGYSGPLDEQRFLVNTINRLEQTPEWSSTAVIINWDDSDGWYDHVMPPIVRQSNDPLADALDGPGNAGTPAPGTYLDRAGFGPRIPLLVISPYARHNFVDNSLTSQSSILRFIEDNWNLGRLGDQSADAQTGSLMNMFDFSQGPSNQKLFLDPNTGEPVSPAAAAFNQNGKVYMALSNLSEVLDATWHQAGHSVWFTYNGHLVQMPLHGRFVTVDGSQVDLGANMKTVNGALFVPVDNLAQQLGVQVTGLAQGVAQPAN